MANGLFIQLPGEFSDTTIPKLYRDKLITAGTKFVFDSVDTFSWAKQTAPLATDVWINLLDGGATASFGTGIAFDKKAFKLIATGGDIITLPASGIAASDADGFAMALWFLPDAPPYGSSIMTAADNFNTLNQYSMTWGESAANWALSVYVDGQKTDVGFPSTLPAATPLQLGLSYKKRASDGKYDLNVYKNGVSVRSFISAATTIKRPTTLTAPRIGDAPSYGQNGWQGHILRTWFDDCSIKNAPDLIALDYAENLARLTAATV